MTADRRADASDRAQQLIEELGDLLRQQVQAHQAAAAEAYLGNCSMV